MWWTGKQLQELRKCKLGLDKILISSLFDSLFTVAMVNGAFKNNDYNNNNTLMYLVTSSGSDKQLLCACHHPQTHRLFEATSL